MLAIIKEVLTSQKELAHLRKFCDNLQTVIEEQAELARDTDKEMSALRSDLLNLCAKIEQRDKLLDDIASIMEARKRMA